MSDSSQGTPLRSARRPRGVRVLHALAVASLMVGTLCAAGALWEARAEARDAEAYPPPGQLVDIGAHRLHLVCTGVGSPTVIIDAGLGDWSTSWSLVQPDIARVTRICTYDRAGSGWSDPGPQQRTSKVFARELHTLLMQADVRGPYVLVGHSLGGLTAQVFSAEHPSEVAGLVLVDSMSPSNTTRPASEVQTPTPLPFSADFLARGLGHLGIARLFAGPAGARPTELSREAGDVSVALGVRPIHVQAFVDEFAAIPESLAQAAEIRSLGSLPVTVLSRAVAKSDDTWRRQQADLLRLSSDSRQVISASSDHSIHQERPDETVAAILDMVARSR